MDLQTAIEQRRSVRSYTNQPVAKELIQKLIDAATLAPSATNSQPWTFGVIQDKALLNRYSDEAKAFLLEHLEDCPPLLKYRSALSNPAFNIFYEASSLIIIYAKPVGPNPVVDCSLAAQNMMLTAAGLGLGTCWIGFAVPQLERPEIKLELNVPVEYQAVAAIIVGYPQSASLPPVPRKPAELLFSR